LALVSQEWAHLAVLRETWVRWSTTMEQQRMTAQFAEDVNALAEIAEQLQAAGEISIIGTRAIRIAAQRTQLLVQEFNATAAQQAMVIRALMGFSPQAPVQLQASVTLPTDLRQQLPQHPQHAANAAVLLAVARHQASEAALRLEIRRQFPDLQLGFAYEDDRGDRSLGPSFGFTLPLWHANAPAIAKATAMRDADAAEVQATYVAAKQDWAQAEQIMEDRTQRLRLLQEQIVPLIDAQVADVRRLAQLGDLDVALVLEALDAAWQTRRDVVLLQAELTCAENRLIALNLPTWLLSAASTTTTGVEP
jgi:outer membrane protein TolC